MLHPSLGRTVRNDEGYALLAVLVLGMLIGAVSLAISSASIRLATRSAELTDEVEVHHVLEGALNRMIAAYAGQGDPLRAAIASDGRPVNWQFDQHTVVVRVNAESGKWDVNAGDLGQIQNLITSLCGENADCLQIGTRIAERRRTGIKIESLLEVLAPFDRMSSRRDLIESHFTTLTDQNGIDYRTAPLDTLDAIANFPRDLREDIADARREMRSVRVRDAEPVPDVPFVEEKSIYTLHAATGPGFRHQAAMTAAVMFSERRQAYVLSWRRTGVD